MGISLRPEYDMDLQLTRITVEWNEVVRITNNIYLHFDQSSL